MPRAREGPPFRYPDRSVTNGFPLRAHLRRFFDVRFRSVLRGTVLVLTSTYVAFRLARFPRIVENPWLIVPLLLAIAGTADTTRCMQKRWSWYHGGVVLCIYTDLMAICMIAFFLLYPLWF